MKTASSDWLLFFPTTITFFHLGQDWQNEYKAMKAVDGVEEIGGNNVTSITNETMNGKFLLILNNASVKANVEFMGTNILLEIPPGDTQNVPLVSLPTMSPYKIRTSTKDSDGKELMINGQEEVSFNADDVLNTLVIHKAGE